MNKPTQKYIGVLGATSLVGEHLLSTLQGISEKIIAFSRHPNPPTDSVIKWRKPGEIVAIDFLICLAPIWILVESLPWIKKLGVQKIIALSSTSRFTKQGSSVNSERLLAQRLTEGEHCLESWAVENDVDWVILRPTLIYGLGRDKNICEIAHFIRRFGFFPLLGKACGLRQPIHIEDVAYACLAALNLESPNFQSLQSNVIHNGKENLYHAYNLSGGESLSYRAMVIRVFLALEKPPRLIHIPLWLFKLALLLIRVLPRYKHWSPAMAERMNQDLVFDHSKAKLDFGFKPRCFRLDPQDLPK